MVGAKEGEVVGEWFLSCVRSVREGRELRAENGGPRTAVRKTTGRELRAEKHVRAAPGNREAELLLALIPFQACYQRKQHSAYRD
jgi:hypothetical protein